MYIYIFRIVYRQVHSTNDSSQAHLPLSQVSAVRQISCKATDTVPLLVMEHLRTYLLVFVTLNPSVWGQLDVIASIELTTADCLECDMTAFGRFGAMVNYPVDCLVHYNQSLLSKICSKSNEFGCCFTAYMKGMYLQNQTDTFNSFDNLLECFFFEVDNNDELSRKQNYHCIESRSCY